jgi:hypothetical protein
VQRAQSEHNRLAARVAGEHEVDARGVGERARGAQREVGVDLHGAPPSTTGAQW